MSRLLELPTDVLRLVMRALKQPDDTMQRHQHALRCTCTAVRDASNAWITHVRICSHGDKPDPDQAALQHLQQLSHYPMAAQQQLRILSLIMYGGRVTGIPAFFQAAAARLGSLQSVWLDLTVSQVA